MLGYIVLRVTPRQITQRKALTWIQMILALLKEGARESEGKTMNPNIPTLNELWTRLITDDILIIPPSMTPLYTGRVSIPLCSPCSSMPSNAFRKAPAANVSKAGIAPRAQESS